MTIKSGLANHGGFLVESVSNIREKMDFNRELLLDFVVY